MLRGLDATTEGPDDAVMVKVADRAGLDGDLAVYLRESPPEYVRDRSRTVLDVLDTLVAAGVTEDVPIVRWPERVRDPPADPSLSVLDVYEEFVDAVGRRSLEPFFEETGATAGADRVVELPPICIALRTDGALTGLYPHWNDGVHHSIEDCLRSLTAGERIANVER